MLKLRLIQFKIEAFFPAENCQINTPVLARFSFFLLKTIPHFNG
jgi:hypothetical protein